MLIEKKIFSYYGHEDVEQRLLLAVQQNKLHHGLLLAGPEGVGKSTFALRFACFLMTGAKAPSIQLDADNPVVRRMLSGGHGDFKYVVPDDDKASMEISVEQVRQVSLFLSKTPLEGGWRIVVIDGILNRQAANALLKSLEEPPRQALIILVAKHARQILPTIRSRCQVVPFRGLSDQHLKQVLDLQEIKDFPVELIPFCQGSPGKAVRLYQADALSLLQDLYTLIEAAQHKPERLYSFCEKYAAKPKKGALEDKFWVVFELLTQIVFQKAQGQQGSFPVHKNGVEWAEAWQSIQKIQNDAQQCYLDRTQSLLAALRCLMPTPEKAKEHRNL